MIKSKGPLSVEEMCESADPQSDIEHFIVCPTCGQIFDCRVEEDVRHHAHAVHKPKL
jgi:hypothetical protein